MSNEVRLINYDSEASILDHSININSYSWAALCNGSLTDFSKTIETFRSGFTLCPPLADLIPDGGYMRKSCLEERSAEVCKCLNDVFYTCFLLFFFFFFFFKLIIF